MRHYFLLMGVISLLFISCGGSSNDRLENAERVVEEKYPDGKEKVVVYYSKDDKHEKLMEEKFHEDGNIFWTGNFKNGERDGLWRSWYKNKNVWSEGNYIEGKRDGVWKCIYPNGRIHIKGYYKNDIKTGAWPTYDANGNIIKVEKY